MNKSWMLKTHRFGEKYSKGVKQFISIASGHADGWPNRIKCSYRKCENCYYKPIDEVEDDLFINEIDKYYTWWVFHEEEDPFRINLRTNHVDENASAKDINEVEKTLNDINMGTFLEADTGESSTTTPLSISLSIP